jgi:hypothetical protein
VAASRVDLPDKDGKFLGLHLARGHAAQQDPSVEDRDECHGQLDEGLDAREPGDVAISPAPGNPSGMMMKIKSLGLEWR